MMKIFDIFDPSNSMWLNLNWLTILFPLIMLMMNYWLMLSRWMTMIKMIYLYLNNELKVILKKKIYSLNFISLFYLIMFINLFGLFSYIFTSSSHMSINLSFSLPFWISFMIMGWMFNTNHMLSHQIPLGTPNILMPFMVMIEFISNIIRPGTLSIRLTANMIAGHLILTLISNSNNNFLNLLTPLNLMIQIILLMLELSVACIQAYVFIILTSLYSQEI